MRQLRVRPQRHHPERARGQHRDRIEPLADKRIEVTWQNLRRDLEGLGADAATLDVLEATVGESPEVVGSQGESLFAAHGRLLAVHTLAVPPKANRAVVGPAADTVDTVLDWDRQLPHVVFAIDRQGGDIDGTGVARSTMRAVARSAGAPCTSFE